MTRSDAIDYVKSGYSAHHPQTQGYIEEKVNFVSTSVGISERKSQIVFVGNCSINEGWHIEWLGEY